jgi:hypothetical protein
MGGKTVEEQMQLLKSLQGLDQELGRIRENRQKLEKEQQEIGAEQERVQAMIDSLSADIDGSSKLGAENLARRLAWNVPMWKRPKDGFPRSRPRRSIWQYSRRSMSAKKINKDILDQIQEKDNQISALELEREGKARFAECSEGKSERPLRRN